jgi:hypothetical protein
MVGWLFFKCLHSLAAQWAELWVIAKVCMIALLVVGCGQKSFLPALVRTYNAGLSFALLLLLFFFLLGSH